MKAFAKTSASQIDLIDVPIPGVGANELLIKELAIGVGIHDEYFLPPNIVYPYVVGIEAAGVIEKVGTNVTDYDPGQRIAFVSAMQPKGGTWAEYSVIADNSLVVPIPKSLSFEQAAALPVAGNTILRALHALNLKAGDTVFIAGGSGAIGALAIQIATQRGYRVAASASSKNHDYMRSLGAELTVDYHDSDWQQQILDWQPDGVDAVIATQPGTAADSESIVRDSGTIVAISGDQFVPKRNIALQQIPQAVDVRAELIDLFDQVASSKIQLSLEKVYPFDEALEALIKVQTRHARGKLVLSLQANQDQLTD